MAFSERMEDYMTQSTPATGDFATLETAPTRYIERGDQVRLSPARPLERNAGCGWHHMSSWAADSRSAASTGSKLPDASVMPRISLGI